MSRGLAVPEEQVCGDVEAALVAAGEFGYPVLVKPIEVVTSSDAQPVRHRSRQVADEATLRVLARRLGACIVQRHIDGVVVSIAGVFGGGRLLATVMGRHHRVWPPEAGSATYVESIVPDTRTLDRVCTFLRAMGWQGLWQLQFIESADKQLYPIDFNPRPYGCMGLAAAAGVPLASVWCAWLGGKNPTPTTARPGVRWKAEDNDLRHILWRLRRGHWREAAHVAASKADVHAYSGRPDPLPLLARTAQLSQTMLIRARRSRCVHRPSQAADHRRPPVRQHEATERQDRSSQNVD